MPLVDHGFRLRPALPGELWCSAHRPCHEATDALVLPQLLTAVEIEELLHAPGPAYPPREHRMLRGTNTGPAAVHDVAESPSHVKLFLHRGGHFSREMPALRDKLVHAMIAQPGYPCDRPPPERETTPPTLSIRCVELHTYNKGGSLMSDGHRDRGSALTLSVLLSDEFEGGQFITWKERFHGSSPDATSREPVYHQMKRGDGILFHSEKTHNVAPVTSGVRHSLVIEIWCKPENSFDRSR